MAITTDMPADVAAVFNGFPDQSREKLLAVRGLIFDVANEHPNIGRVEEALRWGEPAYITVNKRTGSTIRLGVERRSNSPAIFFNCKTTLVEGFREQCGSALKYSKNRWAV